MLEFWIFKVMFYHSWRVPFFKFRKSLPAPLIVFSVSFSFQNLIENYIGLFFVSLKHVCAEKDPAPG